MTPTAYRYQLETGSKKHRCPNCGKRTFTGYVDTSTGEMMPEHLGRCDREQNCRYWSKPTRCENIAASSLTKTFTRSLRAGEFCSVALPPPKPSLISSDMMAASVKQGHSSTFVRWLQQWFGYELAADAVKCYHIGASKHWNGANVFWQVDSSGRIRGGKVMLYDTTGHRVKVPTSRVTWVHSVLKLKGYNLRQCYFGEHLLADRPSDPVAIVESEKTAIVASLHVPAFVWMATGGKNGCKWKTDSTVNRVLKGRKVVLFPDLGAFADWLHLADRLREAGAQVRVNDLLEQHATEDERANGLDLADYLLREQPKSVEVNWLKAE